MAIGYRGGGMWKTLGIPRTRDRNEIRRAYARQLKITNPEDDPEGFKILRAAYEQALAQVAIPEGFYAVSHPEVIRPEEVEAVVTVKTVDLAKSDPVPPSPESQPKPQPGPRSQTEPRIEPEVKPDLQAEAKSIPDAKPQPRYHVRSNPEVESRPLPPPPSPPSPMAELQHALGGLEALLRRNNGDAAAILAAFKAIIRSPMMDNIGVHTAAEAQLPHLINRYAPQSDVLLDPAIALFHWDHTGFQIRTSPAVLHVLRRNTAMPILKRLRTKGDVYHPAYCILSAPPKPVTWFSRLKGPTPDAVRDLLRRIREKHPILLNDLNAETVAAYDAYDAVPRLKTWGVWSCGLALISLVIAPIGWLIIPPVEWPVMAVFLPPLAMALVAMTQLYAFAWPRYLWQEGGYRFPPWARWGWAATGLAALVLAACPPWWPVTVLAVLLSAITLPWAGATCEPDRTPGQVPWQMRIFLSNPLLLLWWVATAWSFPLGTQIQMTAALIAFAAAPGLAKLSLHDMWQAAPKNLRMVMPAILFVLSLAAAALLIFSLTAPAVKIWAFAFVAAIVVTNRAPALVTWRFQFSPRMIWLGIIVISNGAAAVGMLFAWVFLAGAITIVWNMASMVNQFLDARRGKKDLRSRAFGG